MTRHGGRPSFHVAHMIVVGTKRARDRERTSTDTNKILRVFVLRGVGPVPSVKKATEVPMSHAVSPPHLLVNA